METGTALKIYPTYHRMACLLYLLMHHECVSAMELMSNLTATLQVTAKCALSILVQFVFPVYIWSIARLIIVLVKYSDGVAKVMGSNSVPVLATLFLLSYAKLFRTIITALSYTTLYTSQGLKAVWSADGNVDYLGPKHVPLPLLPVLPLSPVLADGSVCWFLLLFLYIFGKGNLTVRPV